MRLGVVGIICVPLVGLGVVEYIRGRSGGPRGHWVHSRSFWCAVGFIRIRLLHSGEPRGRWVHSDSFRGHWAHWFSFHCA